MYFVMMVHTKNIYTRTVAIDYATAEKTSYGCQLVEGDILGTPIKVEVRHRGIYRNYITD